MRYKRFGILLIWALLIVSMSGTPAEAAKTKIRAERIQNDVTNFDGVLSGSDTDVQTALETIDEISLTGVPAGNDGNVQYNNSSAFGGKDELFFDDTNNRLGVGGITTPDDTLHVWDGSAGSIDSHVAAQITIEDDTANALQFLVPANSASAILFGDALDNDVGGIWYNHIPDFLGFTAGTNNVMCLDGPNQFVGVNTLTPSEALDVVGSIQMVDGNEGVGKIAVDDGTGTGVMEWAAPESAGLLGSATGTVPVSSEPTAITLVSSFATAGSTAFVNVACGTPNDGYNWNALSYKGKFEGMVTYWWSADTGNLVAYIINDSESEVEVVVWYGS